MKNVLILGAGGQIAQRVIEALAGRDDITLTLFMRNPTKLHGSAPYIDMQAKSVIAAMQSASVARLISILSLGIYDEVPGKFGEWNRQAIGEDLKPFRRAADAIETSNLDYTIVRPTDEDDVDYELTGRHDPFKGTVVSRRNVADLIVRTIDAPGLHVHASVGVNKPHSDGDKPYFM